MKITTKQKLVKKFNTPIYCYSYDRLKMNINNFINKDLLKEQHEKILEDIEIVNTILNSYRV